MTDDRPLTKAGLLAAAQEFREISEQRDRDRARMREEQAAIDVIEERLEQIATLRQGLADLDASLASEERALRAKLDR